MSQKTVIVGQKERVAAWVAPRVARQSPWSDYEAIGLEQDGELIAGVVYDGYVADARICMHVAATGKRWLNREYLWACFAYAFVQLNCEVVIGMVDADNAAALAFDAHLGFSEACRIPKGGGRCDLVILTMGRKTCRWLKLKRART